MRTNPADPWTETGARLTPGRNKLEKTSRETMLLMAGCSSCVGPEAETCFFYINNTFESFKGLLILKKNSTQRLQLEHEQPGEAELLCSLSNTLGHDSIFRTHSLILEI